MYTGLKSLGVCWKTELEKGLRRNSAIPARGGPLQSLVTLALLWVSSLLATNNIALSCLVTLLCVELVNVLTDSVKKSSHIGVFGFVFKSKSHKKSNNKSNEKWHKKSHMKPYNTQVTHKSGGQKVKQE